MTSEVTIQALEVDALAEQFGVSDLQARLAAGGIPLLERDDHSYVIPARSWIAYIKGLILGDTDGATLGSPPPSPGGQFVSKWGPQREAFLASHPRSRELLDSFFRRFLSESGTTVGGGNWWKTLKLPAGGQAGVKPEAHGFKFRAQRGQGDGTMKLFELRVTDESEFDAAMDWLKALPKYENARVWRTRR